MQRLGVSKNWKTVTAILKKNAKNLAMHQSGGEQEIYAKFLDSYLNNEPTYLMEYLPVKQMVEITGKKRIQVFSALGVTGTTALYRLEVSLLNEIAFNQWAEDVRFCYNRSYVYAVNDMYPSPLIAGFESSVRVLCRCLYLGWNTRAEQLMQLITATYRRQGFFDVSEIRGESLYNWFYRIALDHYGITFTDWPQDAYTLAQEPDHGNRAPKVGDQIEPVLNFMYDIWDKPDLSADTELILNFCDYYTHRCKVKQGYEFSNNWVEMRFPFIILAWFKLRQMRGLSVPQIDHPLMQTNPSAHFIPEQPYPNDEILDKAIARLKAEELPNLVLV